MTQTVFRGRTMKLSAHKLNTIIGTASNTKAIRTALTLLAIAFVSVIASKPRAVTAQDDAPIAEEARIAKLLQTQVDCWNDGDIDGFMETYWNSEELTFSSGGQTTRGWQATIDRYKLRYSTRALMGRLTFSELEVNMIGADAAFVLGRWALERESDNPKGNFSLVLKRIDGAWKIVHDHSSSEDEVVDDGAEDEGAEDDDVEVEGAESEN